MTTMTSTSRIHHETLRSSVTLQGDRLFLIYDPMRNLYRVATRWSWLTSFSHIDDACDAFETLELVNGDIHQAASLAKAEISRRTRVATSNRGSSAMKRTWLLVDCIELHLLHRAMVHTVETNEAR